MTNATAAPAVEPADEGTPTIRLGIAVLGALVVWFVGSAVGLFTLWLGSYASTAGLHAVELSDGYLHGGRFDCADVGIEVECRIELDDRELFVRTPVDRPGDCSATFGGADVDCAPVQVTSSYWAKGVAITDPAVIEAVEADGVSTREPRTWLLGHSEPAMIRAVAFYAILITLSAAGLGAALRRRSGDGAKALLWLLGAIPFGLLGLVVLEGSLLVLAYVD